MHARPAMPRTGLSGRLRRRLVAAAIGVTVACFAGSGVHATVEQPVDAGEVQMIDANDPSNVLIEGDSNTEFVFRLPDGASCPGDSANDDWRVQSFITPATDDPGTLTYGVIWPDGEGRFAVYGVDTRPYTHAMTGQNDVAGQPGLILTPPPMTFGVFPAGTLPESRYRIGLACTYFRETARYWDIELILTEDPEVQPGEFSWRVAGVPQQADAGASSDAALRWILTALGAGAVVAVLLVAKRRIGHRPPALSKEQT